MNKTVPADTMRRIAAFLIDVVVIYCYIFLLFIIASFVQQFWNYQESMAEHYFVRHSVSFLFLTLPVILYFILLEYSEKKATPGKRWLKLQVINKFGERASLMNLIIRNGIKFLPWEIAHTLLHLRPYILFSDSEPGLALLIAFSFPQLLILFYLGIILVNQERRSIYEILSGTRVIKVA